MLSTSKFLIKQFDFLIKRYMYSDTIASETWDAPFIFYMMLWKKLFKTKWTPKNQPSQSQT